MIDANDDEQKPKRPTSELKVIRKTMSTILRTISSMKTSPFDEIKSKIISDLKSQDRDITTLIDEDDNTLAHLCVKESKIDILRVIVECYSDILSRSEKFFKWLMLENNEQLNIYDLSAQIGNKEVIKYLYEVIISEEENTLKITERRNNVFHNAAKNNQCYPIIFFFEKLQKLYPKTLVIDVPNQFGITPLHYACYHGSKKAMDLLIDLGCNIDGVDQDGNTPLHYAVQSGSERAVKKLLVRGANKFIKNTEGNTPYDVAVNAKNDDLSSLLFHRNWFQRIFSASNEIGAVKGNRNNLMLLFIVLILIFTKILFCYRITDGLYNNVWDGQLMPYIPNLRYAFNTTNELIKGSSDPQKKREMKDLVGCFSGDNCPAEQIIVYISLIGDLFNLIIIVYFLCFAKKVYVPKRSKKEVRSLTKLFEEQKSVCVKCRIVTDSETMHCLVCNACVDNWDHHCFWLNTCINTENKKSFKFFFYTMFIFTMLNMLFFLESKFYHITL